MYQFRTQAGPPDLPPEEFPEDEPFDPAPLEAARNAAVKGLIFAVATFLLAVGGFIWEHYQTGQVTASRPIGHLIGMSGPGALAWPVVIETEQGFFPLREAVAIDKGTPLQLEDRASGKRFVCDVQRVVCVQTSFESMLQPASARAAP
jgi:hypothetical protein